MVKAVGVLIRDIRQSEGKTQAELGRATGITRTRINKIESGVAHATPEEISAIANHFGSLEIIRAYWVDSPMHKAATKICNDMGMPLMEDSEATARQFAVDMMNRCQRIISLSNYLSPDDEARRYENIVLIGREAHAINNLSAALRMLFCDIKGGI